ncbi:hypothetical protein [Nonomuraea rubra]|uniref:hypothetical protein n=1 Tax=Nonomuraea rubra TaxID=46180 RepID=UPI0031E81DAB
MRAKTGASYIWDAVSSIARSRAAHGDVRAEVPVPLDLWPPPAYAAYTSTTPKAAPDLAAFFRQGRDAGSARTR